MSLGAVQPRTEQPNFPPSSPIKEGLNAELQQLFDSYHVILTHNPAQWHLYHDIAKLLPSSAKQAHLLLKGAWHALDRGEYEAAQKLSDAAQERHGVTFSARIIDLELLRRQGREKEILKKLLQIADIFKRNNLPDQEVKAYKRLVILDPQIPYYQRILILYTQLGKVEKASKWAAELSHRAPPQAPSPPALPPRPAQQRIPDIAFGKALWAEFFGDVGVEPPLPPDIDKILNSPCPIWGGGFFNRKKVRETHLLVLIPETVNGKPLNLKTLGELIQKPLQGQSTKYTNFYLGEYQDPVAPKSHWALLSRDVLPGSRNQSYRDQQAQVASIREKTKLSYEVPTILDATVCILMEYFRTGSRLYSDSPWTCTRCQEKFNGNWQLFVGGFAPAGLHISNGYGNDVSGVGVLRKFF